MRSKECGSVKHAPEMPSRPVPHAPRSTARRFMLLSALAASCPSSGPALAGNQEPSQRIPEVPSELLAFSQKISKLEVHCSSTDKRMHQRVYPCSLHELPLLLQEEAVEAYARRDFKRAVDKLSELIYQQPSSARWSEMRAQVLVDGNNFAAAVMDYNEAMNRTPGTPPLCSALLTAALAHLPNRLHTADSVCRSVLTFPLTDLALSAIISARLLSA
jgi:hypothetical protein